jgi:hypothetical protein
MLGMLFRFFRSVCRIELSCDISAWMHSICAVFQMNHAGAGKSPELRTLFFRLRVLLKLPLHIIFVFDGLTRLPDKGHKVRHSPHWLTRDFQCMVDLFGFRWTEVSRACFIYETVSLLPRHQVKPKPNWLL